MAACRMGAVKGMRRQRGKRARGRWVIRAIVTATCAVTVTSCGGLTQVGLKSEVLLVPNVNGGYAGWCMRTAGTSNAGIANGCALARVGYPIIAQTWTGKGPPPTTNGYAIVAPQVARVSVNGGSPIRTRSEVRLPGHLRYAMVEIRGMNLVKETTHGNPPPRFTPVSDTGQRLPEANGLEAQLGVRLPTRSLRNAARPLEGICDGPGGCLSAPRAINGFAHRDVGACRIEARGLPSLVAEGGSVLIRVVPQRQLLGRAFVSCASTAYTLEGWPLLVSVLLDATHPGTEPAELPKMEPVPGHPGIFEAVGSEGEMLARRIQSAWIVVAKGEAKGEGIQ